MLSCLRILGCCAKRGKKRENIQCARKVLHLPRLCISHDIVRALHAVQAAKHVNVTKTLSIDEARQVRKPRRHSPHIPLAREAMVICAFPLTSSHLTLIRRTNASWLIRESLPRIVRPARPHRLIPTSIPHNHQPQIQAIDLSHDQTPNTITHNASHFRFQVRADSTCREFTPVLGLDHPPC